MQIQKAQKNALLLGATGLIGQHCLNLLLESPLYKKVTVLTRRPLPLEHPKLVQHLINFEELDDYAAWIKGDDLFCCLGTTRRKAGSKQAFAKVDFTYVVQIAQHAAHNRVNQLLLVSSIGADTESPFFYSQIKGQVEKAVQALPFWSVHIFRPSILLGKRDEQRLGESVAARTMKLLDFVSGGRTGKLRPIEATQVAKAMLVKAQGIKSGFFVYESDEIQAVGSEFNVFNPKNN